MNSKPLRAVVASILYAAIAAAVLLGIFALTPSEHRNELLTNYAPAIIAGIPGVLAWLRSKDAAQLGADNARRLNGSLDERIRTATKQALEMHGDQRAKNERKTDRD